MNKSLSLVLITLLFVVLGCNLDQLTGSGNEDVPTPVTDANSNGGDETASSSPDGEDGTGDSSSSSSESGSADVTLDKFNKLEMGMSYDEAKEIMGSEGNQTSMTKTGSYESASYEWKGEKYSRISTRFTRGELSYKSQSSISPASGDAPVSQDKFNKINIGMSYDEVKDTIGSEGELQSESKFGDNSTATYVWKGPNYSRITGVFRDGKLQNKSQSRLGK